MWGNVPFPTVFMAKGSCILKTYLRIISLSGWESGWEPHWQGAYYLSPLISMRINGRLFTPIHFSHCPLIALVLQVAQMGSKHFQKQDKNSLKLSWHQLCYVYLKKDSILSALHVGKWMRKRTAPSPNAMTPLSILMFWPDRELVINHATVTSIRLSKDTLTKCNEVCCPIAASIR